MYGIICPIIPGDGVKWIKPSTEEIFHPEIQVNGGIISSVNAPFDDPVAA